MIDYVEFQPASLGPERFPGSSGQQQCGTFTSARLIYNLYALYDQNQEDQHDYDHHQYYLQSLARMSNKRWLTRHATLVIFSLFL